ncbi:MAG: hypothetical protein JSV91_05360 [Phycisphaerales bacterium]|nr:MAG: hypothetical protein JSV91_05360 [Phycisphaerales bacterium]
MTRFPTEPPMVPEAPPTVGAPVIQRQSAWPTVVGVIAIVWAILSYLGACFNLVMPWFLPVYHELVSRSMPPSEIRVLEATVPPAEWAIITGLVALILATLLTVGAVRLLKRRQSGATLCNLWAAVSVFWVFAGLAINSLLMISRGGEELLNSPMIIGAILGACVGLGIGCALPVFMLIWFSRLAIREEVAEWRIQ